MKNLILGLSILAIVYTGILYCCGNDSSLSFPYHITYNGQLSINNHYFIVYGNVTRNNDSSYYMESMIFPKNTLSHILLSLSWGSTGPLLTIPIYVIPTLSYTAEKITKLIDLVATTWIILPLQDWWKLSGMSYHIIEDYDGYKRWLFSWLLLQSLPGYTSMKIPYEGTYNLYCIPSILTFLLQKSCNITIKTNINTDDQPIIITSTLDFIISPIR